LKDRKLRNPWEKKQKQTPAGTNNDEVARTLKFIHTSDWHLGRIFYGIHLTVDQAYVLEELLLLIKDEQPDLLIVAGDVYDRAVPPPEAVELLDDVVSRIILDLKVPVLIISGNHDNPRRLGFGSRLLESRGLYLKCFLDTAMSPFLFNDHHGPVRVYAVPYAEPAITREIFGDETLHSHQSAMNAVMNRINADLERGGRTIVVTHAFVAGGEESESERPLSVGGTGVVDAGLFARVHYTALGHLHKAQKIGDREVYYSGSLLKYSFSESTHTKSVQVAEMDGTGMCRVKQVPLRPRKDVQCIEGYFVDLMKKSPPGISQEDYLMATLCDQGVILDAMPRLREVYPNLLHIRKPFVEVDREHKLDSAAYQKLGAQELFTSFVAQVTGEEISDSQVQEFQLVREQVNRKGWSE
jgi:DNA repair protein SbcD/Mre11